MTKNSNKTNKKSTIKWYPKCLGVLKIPRKQIRVLLGAFMQVGNDKVSNNLAKCIGVYKREKVEQTVLKG